MNIDKTDIKKTIGNIIATRRRELSLGLREVCEQIPELEVSALSHYEHGRRQVPLEIVNKLAKVLKVTPGYILALETFDNNESLELTTTKTMGRIPLMAWSAVGVIRKDKALATVGLEHIETTEPIRSNTFALKVRDDSMESKFPTGAIIVVEPELDHQSGDYVIVLNGSTEATFRQIIQDGADWFLKPENTRYPIKPLAKDFRIIGVVTAMEMKFRNTRS